MENRFIMAWRQNRTAAEALGARMRPVSDAQAVELARRCLSGSRDSDGFGFLQQQDRLDLTLEALAVKKDYTALFTDEQVNNALMRLLEAGYRFK